MWKDIVPIHYPLFRQADYIVATNSGLPNPLRTPLSVLASLSKKTRPPLN
ncbi:hypothetical protein DSUL_20151 [Desulfovibrionales bacterium]